MGIGMGVGVLVWGCKCGGANVVVRGRVGVMASSRVRVHVYMRMFDRWYRLASSDRQGNKTGM